MLIIRIVSDLACTLRTHTVQFDDGIAIRQKLRRFGKKRAFRCRKQTGKIDVLIFSALGGKSGAVFYHKIFVDENRVVFVETRTSVESANGNGIDLFRFSEPAQSVFEG